MVNEHVVLGSKSTSCHSFGLTTEGLSVHLTAGEYHNNGEVKVSSTEDLVIEIPVSSLDTDYEIWLESDSVSVLARSAGEQYGELTSPVDRIAWFTVPANSTTLDTVEVNFVKVVDEDES
jgi:hypothetical protein